MLVYCNIVLKSRDESKKAKAREFIETKFKDRFKGYESKYDAKTFAYNIKIEATDFPILLGMLKASRYSSIKIQI